MALNEKNIFLLDGTGAFLSAAGTGLILPLLSDWVGLPKWYLYSLAIVAVCYCVYSWSCFWVIRRTRPSMLLALIVANLCFCLVLVFTFFLFKSLTIWGQAYLAAEAAIILTLVALEIRIFRCQALSPEAPR